MTQPEVAIRGAGPVGCVLALLLHQAGRRVVFQGEQRQAQSALRPIALSHASRLILERAGAWQALDATPIKTIHVSQQGAFGRTRLEAADAGVPALGYVVAYAPLLEVLLARVKQSGIPIEGEAREAPLVVHAEGSSTEAKEKTYRQDAVVALVTTRPGATGTAWERFTPEGPLALLPLAGSYCVFWGMDPSSAVALC